MGIWPYILQFLFNICEISIDLYGSNPFSVLQNIPLCKYTIYSVAENVGDFQLSSYLKQYLTHGVFWFFFGYTHGMQDFSSPTTNPTCIPCTGSMVQTIGPPEKSQHVFLFICPWNHLGKFVKDVYLGMKLLYCKVWTTWTLLDIAELPSNVVLTYSHHQCWWPALLKFSSSDWINVRHWDLEIKW